MRKSIMVTKLARLHAGCVATGRPESGPTSERGAHSGPRWARAFAGRAVVRPVLLAAMVALASSALCAPAETDASMPIITGTDLNARFVPLGIGKSVVVDLPRDAKDVLVANTQIANAVVRSARRAYLIG